MSMTNTTPGESRVGVANRTFLTDPDPSKSACRAGSAITSKIAAAGARMRRSVDTMSRPDAIFPKVLASPPPTMR